MKSAVLENKTEHGVNLPERLTLLAMLLCTALTGFITQEFLTYGVIAGMVVLLLRDKIYLGFPFVIFYNSFYGLPLGFSVLRIYSILLLLSLVLRIAGRAKFKVITLVPLTIYMLFIVLVLMQNGVVEGFMAIIEVICVIIISNELSNRDGGMVEFFKVYALLSVLSFFSGIVLGNTIGDEYNYVRFMGTFEDPNYMGFFFTVGIFATITLKLFGSSILRYGIVAVLYVGIAMTLSITAILINVMLWIVYLIFINKRKMSGVVVALVVVLLVGMVLSYVTSSGDSPTFIGDLMTRINEKIAEFSKGDISSATTGRTNFAKNNLGFFFSLPVFNILFGGTSINTKHIVSEIKGVSHNEYIDLMINVGIVGAIIMFAFFISTFVSYVKEYKKTEDRKYLTLIVGKLVWLFYGIALTMFLDYRFMLWFFV